MRNRHRRQRGSPSSTPSTSPSPTPPLKDAGWSAATQYLIVAALSVVGFLPSLDGDFVFDDGEAIVNNPVVNGRAPLMKILDSDFWGRPLRDEFSHKSFRPITTFTFWLNWHFASSKIAFHATNLLLHAIVSCLVLRTLKKLHPLIEDEKTEFGAAIAFAVHPIHTEAVANVTGRAELLMALFFLFGLDHFLNTRRTATRLHAFLEFVLLAAVSLFAKEQGAMLIPVCIVVDFLLTTCESQGAEDAQKLPARFLKRTIASSAVFFALTITRLWFNGFTRPRFSVFDNPAAFMENRLFRVVNYLHYALLHLKLLIAPVNMCFDYSMGCIPFIETLTDPRLWIASFCALAGFVSALVVIASCQVRKFILPLALLVLPFLPASNLFVSVGFTVAERILYLPSIGFCLFVAMAARKACRYSKIRTASSILIPLAIVVSYQRSMEWRSEYSLYSAGLSVCPHNAKIHYNLGKVLNDLGERDMAESRYAKALELNPDYEHAMNNLANIREAKGDFSGSEKLLREALQRKPGYATAWMNLGITLHHAGKYQSAERAFLESLALRPIHADTFYNLGNLYLDMGMQNKAESAWLNSTSIDVRHGRSWSNLFVLWDEREECSRAVLEGQRLLPLMTEYAPLHFSLGSCLGKLGAVDEAEEHLLKAIQLQPRNALYHTNLGVLYQRINRNADAEREYKEALRLDSQSSLVRDYLSRLRHNATQRLR